MTEPFQEPHGKIGQVQNFNINVHSKLKEHDMSRCIVILLLSRRHASVLGMNQLLPHSAVASSPLSSYFSMRYIVTTCILRRLVSCS